LNANSVLGESRYTRRHVLRTSVLGAAGLAAAAFIGCDDDDDDDEDPKLTTPDVADLGVAQEFPLVSGWARGDAVQYYDFGMNSPLNAATNAVGPAPIWVFITGMDDAGDPLFLEGQHNVIDVVPGDAAYSDLWEVNLVVVDEDYEADSLRSADAVADAGFETIKPGLFVNCPVVPAGSTLEAGEALTQGGIRDQQVFYPDFGPNPPVAIPIWAFITGMDDAGNPLFVEGQNNVIDSLPGDAGYSAFWRINLVTVPAGYEANSITSASQVAEAGHEVTRTDLMVNCPVV
jgi:hypothetical protein